MKEELTSSQLAELEVARARAERATAGRRGSTRQQQRQRPSPASSSSGGTLGGGGAAKKHKSAVEAAEESEELSEDHPNDSVAAKDARKLRRLLRNRVSAQQARERKKNFVSNLQELVAQQQSRITQLEQQLQAATTEGTTLRRIILNMQAPDTPPFAQDDNDFVVPGMPGDGEAPHFTLTHPYGGSTSFGTAADQQVC